MFLVPSKISSTVIHKFLSNLGNGQTNKQTNKQTQAKHVLLGSGIYSNINHLTGQWSAWFSSTIPNGSIQVPLCQLFFLSKQCLQTITAVSTTSSGPSLL